VLGDIIGMLSLQRVHVGGQKGNTWHLRVKIVKLRSNDPILLCANLFCQKEEGLTVILY